MPEVFSGPVPSLEYVDIVSLSLSLSLTHSLLEFPTASLTLRAHSTHYTHLDLEVDKPSERVRACACV